MVDMQHSMKRVAQNRPKMWLNKRKLVIRTLSNTINKATSFGYVNMRLPFLRLGDTHRKKQVQNKSPVDVHVEVINLFAP